MKTIRRIAKLFTLPLLGVLVSCGGGGDVAGSKTDFSVVPAKFELAAAKGDVSCQFTNGAEVVVTVLGGIPPYRIVNSYPQVISVSDSVLSGKNPTFKVVIRGDAGCATTMPLLILDYQSRSTNFDVTVTAGEELKTVTPAE